VSTLARLVMLRAFELAVFGDGPRRAVLNVTHEQQAAAESKAAAYVSEKQVADRSTDPVAQRLRDYALALTPLIEKQLRPMTQNHTPKRGREYAKRLHEGHDWQRVRAGLLALAEAREQGRCPVLLQYVTSKSDVYKLLCTQCESNGYYDYRETGKPRNTSLEANALRALIAEGSVSQIVSDRDLKLQAMLNDLRSTDIPGFFPTPPKVIRRMLELAKLPLGHCSILEPSCGIGSILDELAALPGAKHWMVHAFEINHRLREVLALKGYHEQEPCPHFQSPNGVLYVNPDFMSSRADVATYHRVIMNPPFEKDQDMQHVRHAWEYLVPGGRLVAVMCNGWRFRGTGYAPVFREWLEGPVGPIDTSWEELPEDAFNGTDAFRRTGVRCGILTLQK
jgi:hypothetical protein